MSISVEPIGHVRGGRVEVEDDNWGNVVAIIELSDALGSEALAGLDEFSHAEIIFLFDRVPDAKIERGARRPRGRTDWPLVGIFAQRGRNRPNRIGSTMVEVLALEGRTVHVRGLDAVDGTPVLDIKPAMSGFMPRGELRADLGERNHGYLLVSSDAQSLPPTADMQNQLRFKRRPRQRSERVTGSAKRVNCPERQSEV